jgi:hypothetical protein
VLLWVGIHPVDANWFNGTLSELLQLAGLAPAAPEIAAVRAAAPARSSKTPVPA